MLIKVVPKFRPMIWGNPELNNTFNLSTKEPIGEVWLLSGHPLNETVTEDNKTINLLGQNIYGKKYLIFPLLIKLVSTKQWLSVQVHPDDSFAQTLENEPWGKSEAWYFLSDGEFAVCENVDLMKEYITSGKIDKLNEILTFVKVRKGTFVNIPAGTVHALGPNSTVIEVQQSSDLTYRIYDWGRQRETHIEKALKVARNISLKDIVFENTESLATEHFSLGKVAPSFVDNELNLVIHIPTKVSHNFCATIILNETLNQIQQEGIYIYNFFK
jgi:mannose-6-phosphate isomerase